MSVYMGPFEVDRMVGQATEKLRLPEEWNWIHNVFQVSLTKPYIGSTNLRVKRHVLPPPPVQWLEGEPLYKVESLLDHCVAKKGRKKIYRFLVKWEGYGDEHNTWEPEENLLEAPDEVKDLGSSLQAKAMLEPLLATG
eukprot:1156336-Pelagomonas_calceolata.AAC.2